MDTLIPKGTLLTIPREIIEMIIQLLENQDLASILMTCKYLNDVCEHPKFWKKLEFNAMKIVSATSMCEKIVKKYSVKGVNEFRIYYPRNDPQVNPNGFENIDHCTARIMQHLPKGIERLHFPIFLFKRARNLLTHLQDFTELKTLDMGNHIADFGKFEIWRRKHIDIKQMLKLLFASLKKLLTVKIHDCHGFLEETLEILTSNNQNLKHVDASYCWSLDRPGLQSLSILEDLTDLKLVCCGAHDEDVCEIIQRCQNLKTLDVSWTNVTGTTLVKIYQSNPNIRVLNVIGCYGINYENLKDFTTNARFIQELFIRFKLLIT